MGNANDALCTAESLVDDLITQTIGSNIRHVIVDGDRSIELVRNRHRIAGIGESDLVAVPIFNPGDVSVVNSVASSILNINKPDTLKPCGPSILIAGLS